jgi:GH3 auxin-responsive promoter
MRLILQVFGKLIAPFYHNFLKALSNPQTSQQKVQQEIFSHLLYSEYGQSLGVQTILDWHHIPIVEYHEIENLILQQKENKNPLLTPECILFYEKTSGSRGAAKLIPYTKSLRRSFSKMFCVWTHDLIVNGPRFCTGKIYFCISPQLVGETGGQGQGRNASSLPSPSLQDDSEYLDGWLRLFLSPFMVFPRRLKRVCDVEEFKNKLSLALLLEENLEIISIWSPTFLKVILDYIQANRRQLCATLGNRISPQRRQMLGETAAKCEEGEIEIPWNQLWQELKLISCWDSANAADGAGFLRCLFPNVLVQGKGLLATEAPMTIPIIAATGCVPILDEVFFEFEDVEGKIHYLHQLQKGEVYEIIISQKGGLYRYKIGDRVRVTHFYLNTPCLEFLGRTKEISDLVGEKLHSDFVRQVINTLQLEKTYFKSLVPANKPTEHYILLLDNINCNPEKLAKQLDSLLQESPQYRHARLLGQLNPVRVLVSSQIPEIITLYKMRNGKQWGDLKHEILATIPIEIDLLVELQKVCEKNL